MAAKVDTYATVHFIFNHGVLGREVHSEHVEFLPCNDLIIPLTPTWRYPY